MSEFFEIAYAAASKRLCLFTGTGFSKAVTSNNAPSWQELLEVVCNETSNPAALKKALFPTEGANPLSLEEAAQVIALELSQVDKDIHSEVSKQIRKLSLVGDNEVISTFLQANSVEVITTNYDTLVEQLSGPEGWQSLTPGLPIPRSDARVKVYHVHGSVNSPLNMVVTSEDYFRFINGESYFSRKLSTVLHENTVVILGYSLGDTNLKAIINEYKGFSKSHVIGSNIFLVSRSRVSQYVKDYYHHCYGIRVLDGLEVHDFFHKLSVHMPAATKCAQSSVSNIREILSAGKIYTPEFLQAENSFYEIVSSFSAVGVSINHQGVVSCIGTIIKTKIELTAVSGAWEQYHQMAKWLVYLGSILEIKGTSIEDVYLEAVKKSMSTMRSTYYVGYSWDAYKCWYLNWNSMISSNRSMIKRYIHKELSWPDAFTVVNQ
ncbi:SIR2 family protein [Pseudomonas phytophila]|uniref:SIR2 family protein n=1 Tax=Pseudomonas phytophila TaxID=2867264 RepID=A0ABY6FAB0_9PSED|nr:SIR2 family protein [Pseudomonas phytophila]UXZ94581.1 SIR2 family protein [Pseudomonas phytophila]